MIVVSNTSPLTNLAAIGQFALLQKLYAMVNRILTIFISFLFFCPVGLTASNDKMDDYLNLLPDKIVHKMEARKLPGLSMAIVHDQEIIFKSGFGFANLDTKKPATINTIYPIASITKIFGAIMLIQLCEKEIISLNTPVKNLLHNYPIESTTLQQLASHTAGLQVDAASNRRFYISFMGWLFTRGVIPIKWYIGKDKLLENLNKINLKYDPNAYAHYSNLGTQILGLALEKASGEAYELYIKQHILQPLNMHDSGFDINQAPSARVPVGYVYTIFGSNPIKTPTIEYGCAIYSGGLYSTVLDMAKFISMQFSDDPKIIRAANMHLMQLPHSTPDVGKHNGFALGWGYTWIKGHYSIEKSGAGPGYGSCLMVIPDLKLGIITMSNTWSPISSSHENACGILSGEILEELIPLFETDRLHPDLPTKSIELNQYKGIYSASNCNLDFQIESQDGALRICSVQVPAYHDILVPIDAHTFKFKNESSATIRFMTDRHHQVKSFTFGALTFTKKY